MKKIDEIINYLEELFPTPKPQLIYDSDYSLLIAIVLSAQTTDKRVNEVTKVLFNKYKSLEELSKADIKDIESIIRVLGTYTRKSKYVKDIAYDLINKYDGVVPTNRSDLESLSGVGRKTANVFLNEYYDIPAIGVDTHVSRVSKRLGLCSEKDDVLKIENKLKKIYDKSTWGRRHLQMLLFGRYYCKSINPKCDTCKLKDICKYKKKKS